MYQGKQILRNIIILWIDLGLSPFLSSCQDPRMLLYCIDFRYITDVLTGGSLRWVILKWWSWKFSGTCWRANNVVNGVLCCLRVMMLLIFFPQKYYRKVKLVKKRKVGYEETSFTIFATIALFQKSLSFGGSHCPSWQPGESPWCNFAGRPLVSGTVLEGVLTLSYLHLTASEFAQLQGWVHVKGRIRRRFSVGQQFSYRQF